MLKIKSFKLSEKFNSVAQGVLEIFEEVYLGGGGGGGAMTSTFVPFLANKFYTKENLWKEIKPQKMKHRLALLSLELTFCAEFDGLTFQFPMLYPIYHYL